MDESIALALLLLVTLLMHAAASLMNAALQNVSAAAMRERAEDGDASAQRILALTENPLRLSMTVSITHILTRIAIAVLLVLLVIDHFASGGLGARLALALATIVVGAGLTLIIGELVPEAIGSAQAGPQTAIDLCACWKSPWGSLLSDPCALLRIDRF